MTAPQPGVVHTYARNHTLFEFSTTPNEPAPNVLLFMSGLTNGLLDVPYLPLLAEKLKDLTGERWALAHVLLSSAYIGWGTSSLEKDAFEISLAVKYLRSETGGSRQKIVLQGHSTGCQDVMQYLTKKSQESGFDPVCSVSAGILQAPVSDSEAIRGNTTLIDSLTAEADTYIESGRAKELLPEKFRKAAINTPITAYRFNSLFKRHGDDDYFSTYLTDEDLKLSFGILSKPVLVLYGEKDEFVPESVDKAALVAKWKENTPSEFWSPLSKVLKGAVHDVGEGSDEGAMEDLVQTVVEFIKTIN